MKKPDIDLYDILELSKGATEEEIDKASLKQLMIFHPDKLPPRFYTAATEITKQLLIARKWLRNIIRRTIYHLDYDAKKKRGEFLPSALEVYCDEVIEIKKLSRPKIPKGYHPIQFTGKSIDTYVR